MSSLYKVKGHFNLDFSTPDFSTMNFSTPWFKISWLKSLGLKSSWLLSLGLKGPVLFSGVDISFNHLNTIPTWRVAYAHHIRMSLPTFRQFRRAWRSYWRHTYNFHDIQNNRKYVLVFSQKINELSACIIYCFTFYFQVSFASTINPQTKSQVKIG